MTLNICSERSGAFDTILAQSQPGDQIVYHQGIHCAGAHRAAAYNAACEGRVFLVQRRVEAGVFQYLAIVRGITRGLRISC